MSEFLHADDSDEQLRRQNVHGPAGDILIGAAGFDHAEFGHDGRIEQVHSIESRGLSVSLRGRGIHFDVAEVEEIDDRHLAAQEGLVNSTAEQEMVGRLPSVMKAGSSRAVWRARLIPSEHKSHTNAAWLG